MQSFDGSNYQEGADRIKRRSSASSRTDDEGGVESKIVEEGNGSSSSHPPTQIRPSSPSPTTPNRRTSPTPLLTLPGDDEDHHGDDSSDNSSLHLRDEEHHHHRHQQHMHDDEENEESIECDGDDDDDDLGSSDSSERRNVGITLRRMTAAPPSSRPNQRVDDDDDDDDDDDLLDVSPPSPSTSTAKKQQPSSPISPPPTTKMSDTKIQLSKMLEANRHSGSRAEGKYQPTITPQAIRVSLSAAHTETLLKRGGRMYGSPTSPSGSFGAPSSPLMGGGVGGRARSNATGGGGDSSPLLRDDDDEGDYNNYTKNNDPPLSASSGPSLVAFQSFGKSTVDLSPPHVPAAAASSSTSGLVPNMSSLSLSRAAATARSRSRGHSTTTNHNNNHHHHLSLPSGYHYMPAYLHMVAAVARQQGITSEEVLERFHSNNHRRPQLDDEVDTHHQPKYVGNRQLVSTPVSLLFERPRQLYVGIFISCATPLEAALATLGPAAHNHAINIITTKDDNDNDIGNTNKPQCTSTTSKERHDHQLTTAVCRISLKYVIVTVRTDAVFITDLGAFSPQDALLDHINPPPPRGSNTNNNKNRLISAISRGAWSREVIPPSQIAEMVHQLQQQTQSYNNNYYNSSSKAAARLVSIGAASRRYSALLETIQATATIGAPISRIIPITQLGRIEALVLGKNSNNNDACGGGVLPLSISRLGLVGVQGEQSMQELLLADASFPTNNHYSSTPTPPSSDMKSSSPFVALFQGVDLVSAVERAAELSRGSAGKASIVHTPLSATTTPQHDNPHTSPSPAPPSYSQLRDGASRTGMAQLDSFFTNRTSSPSQQAPHEYSIPSGGGGAASSTMGGAASSTTATMLLQSLAVDSSDLIDAEGFRVGDGGGTASNDTLSSTTTPNSTTHQQDAALHRREHAQVVVRPMSVSEQFEARTRALAGAEAGGGGGSSTAEGRGNIYANVYSALKLRQQLLLEDVSRLFAKEQARARQDLRVLQDFETAACNALAASTSSARVPTTPAAAKAPYPPLATSKTLVPTKASTTPDVPDHPGQDGKQKGNTPSASSSSASSSSDGDENSTSGDDDSTDESTASSTTTSSSDTDTVTWGMLVEAANQTLQDLLLRSRHQHKLSQQQQKENGGVADPVVKERSILQWDVIGAVSAPARIPPTVREHLYPSLLTSIPLTGPPPPQYLLSSTTNSTTTTMNAAGDINHSGSFKRRPSSSSRRGTITILHDEEDTTTINPTTLSTSTRRDSTSRPPTRLLNNSMHAREGHQYQQQQGSGGGGDKGAGEPLRSPFCDEWVVMVGAVVVDPEPLGTSPIDNACGKNTNSPSITSTSSSFASNPAQPTTQPTTTRKSTLKNRLGLLHVHPTTVQQPPTSAHNVDTSITTPTNNTSTGAYSSGSSIAPTIIDASSKKLRVAVVTTTHLNICSLSGAPFVRASAVSNNINTTGEKERRDVYEWGPCVTQSILITSISGIVVFRRVDDTPTQSSSTTNRSAATATSSVSSSTEAQQQQKNVLNCLRIAYWENSKDAKNNTTTAVQKYITIELPDPRGHSVAAGSNLHTAAQQKSAETLRQQLLAESCISPSTPIHQSSDPMYISKRKSHVPPPFTQASSAATRRQSATAASSRTAAATVASAAVGGVVLLCPSSSSITTTTSSLDDGENSSQDTDTDSTVVGGGNNGMMMVDNDNSSSRGASVVSTPRGFTTMHTRTLSGASSSPPINNSSFGFTNGNSGSNLTQGTSFTSPKLHHHQQQHNHRLRNESLASRGGGDIRNNSMVSTSSQMGALLRKSNQLPPTTSPSSTTTAAAAIGQGGSNNASLVADFLVKLGERHGVKIRVFISRNGGGAVGPSLKAPLRDTDTTYYSSNNNEGPEHTSSLSLSTSVGTVFQSYATKAVIQSNFNKGILPRGNNNGNSVLAGISAVLGVGGGDDSSSAKQETSRKAVLQRRIAGAQEQAQEMRRRAEERTRAKETVKAKLSAKRAKRDSRRAAKRVAEYQKAIITSLSQPTDKTTTQNNSPPYHHATSKPSSSLLRHQRRMSQLIRRRLLQLNTNSGGATVDSSSRHSNRINPLQHLFGDAITSLATATTSSSTTTPSSKRTTTARAAALLYQCCTATTSENGEDNGNDEYEGEVSRRMLLSVPLFVGVPSALQHWVSVLAALQPPHDDDGPITTASLLQLSASSSTRHVVTALITPNAMSPTQPPSPPDKKGIALTTDVDGGANDTGIIAIKDASSDERTNTSAVEAPWVLVEEDGNDSNEQSILPQQPTTIQQQPIISEEVRCARSLLEVVRPTVAWDDTTVKTHLKRLLEIKEAAANISNARTIIITNDVVEAQAHRARIQAESYRLAEITALEAINLSAANGVSMVSRRRRRATSRFSRVYDNPNNTNNASSSLATTSAGVDSSFTPVTAIPTTQAYCIRDFRNPSPAILLRYLKGVRKSANNIILARCVLRFTSRRTWVPRVLLLMQNTVERGEMGDGLIEGDDITSGDCTSISLLVLDDNAVVHREIPANKICALLLQYDHSSDSSSSGAPTSSSGQHPTTTDESIYSFSVQGEPVLIVRNDNKRGPLGEKAHGITANMLVSSPTTTTNHHHQYPLSPQRSTSPLSGRLSPTRRSRLQSSHDNNHYHSKNDPITNYFRYVLGASSHHAGNRATTAATSIITTTTSQQQQHPSNGDNDNNNMLTQEERGILSYVEGNRRDVHTDGTNPTIRDFYTILRSRYKYISFNESENNNNNETTKLPDSGESSSPSVGAAASSSTTAEQQQQASSSSSNKGGSVFGRIFANVSSYVTLAPNHITSKTKAGIKSQRRQESEALTLSASKLEGQITVMRSQLSAAIRFHLGVLFQEEHSERDTLEVKEIFTRRSTIGVQYDKLQQLYSSSLAPPPPPSDDAIIPPSHDGRHTAMIITSGDNDEEEEVPSTPRIEGAPLALPPTPDGATVVDQRRPTYDDEVPSGDKIPSALMPTLQIFPQINIDEVVVEKDAPLPKTQKSSTVEEGDDDTITNSQLETEFILEQQITVTPPPPENDSGDSEDSSAPPPITMTAPTTQLLHIPVLGLQSPAESTTPIVRCATEEPEVVPTLDITTSTGACADKTDDDDVYRRQPIDGDRLVMVVSENTPPADTLTLPCSSETTALEAAEMQPNTPTSPAVDHHVDEEDPHTPNPDNDDPSVKVAPEQQPISLACITTVPTPSTSNSPSDSQQDEVSTPTTTTTATEVHTTTHTTQDYQQDPHPDEQHGEPTTTTSCNQQQQDLTQQQQQDLYESLLLEVYGVLYELFITSCESLLESCFEIIIVGEMMIEYQHSLDDMAALELEQRTIITQTNHDKMNERITTIISNAVVALFEEASNEKWVQAIESSSNIDITAYSLLWENTVFDHQQAVLSATIDMRDDEQQIIRFQQQEEERQQEELQLQLLHQQQQAREAEVATALLQEAVSALISEEEFQRTTTFETAEATSWEVDIQDEWKQQMDQQHLLDTAIQHQQQQDQFLKELSSLVEEESAHRTTTTEEDAENAFNNMIGDFHRIQAQIQDAQDLLNGACLQLSEQHNSKAATIKIEEVSEWNTLLQNATIFEESTLRDMSTQSSYDAHKALLDTLESLIVIVMVQDEGCIRGDISSERDNWLTDAELEYDVRTQALLTSRVSTNESHSRMNLEEEEHRLQIRLLRRECVLGLWILKNEDSLNITITIEKIAREAIIHEELNVHRKSLSILEKSERRTVLLLDKELTSRRQIREDEDGDRDGLLIRSVIDIRHIKHRLQEIEAEETARIQLQNDLQRKWMLVVSDHVAVVALRIANTLIRESAIILFGQRIGRLHTPPLFDHDHHDNTNPPSQHHHNADGGVVDNLSMYFTSSSHSMNNSTNDESLGIFRSEKILGGGVGGSEENGDEPTTTMETSTAASQSSALRQRAYSTISVDDFELFGDAFDKAITCTAEGVFSLKQLQVLHRFETCSHLHVHDRWEIEEWSNAERHVLVNEVFIPQRKAILSKIAERMFVEDEEDDVRVTIAQEEERVRGIPPLPLQPPSSSATTITPNTSTNNGNKNGDLFADDNDNMIPTTTNESSIPPPPVVSLYAAADDAGGLSMDRVLRVLLSRQTSGSSTTSSSFSTGLIRRVTNAVSNSGKRSGGGVVLMPLCGPMTSSAERRHASGTDRAGTSTLYDAHTIVQLQQARHTLITSSLKQHEESIFAPEVQSREAVMQIEMQQRLAKQIHILSGNDTFLVDKTHPIRASEESARQAIQSAFIKSGDAVRVDSIRRARQAVVSKPMRVDTQFGTSQAATMKRVTGSKAHRAIPLATSSSSLPQSPTTIESSTNAASRSTSSNTLS